MQHADSLTNNRLQIGLEMNSHHRFVCFRAGWLRTQEVRPPWTQLLTAMFAFRLNVEVSADLAPGSVAGQDMRRLDLPPSLCRTFLKSRNNLVAHL